jgi:spermidine synthase
VLSHAHLGWILALDGALLHVEEDPGPREMLVHVALLGQAQVPSRVLVVGGGDGAVLHEVLKHPVAHVDVVEPEPELQAVAPLLGCAAALCDPRVAFHPILPPEGSWDVVLLDRPLLALAMLGPRLSPEGVIAEWDLAVLGVAERRWLRRGSQVARLAHEQRYHATSPLLCGGFIGYSLHTRQPALHAEPQAAFEGHHYNPELHRAAFALPAFWSALP